MNHFSKKQSIVPMGWISLLLVFLNGCASMQPISNYARSGDTVAISLGGTEANALVPVLKKNNITVTMTDAAGTTHPVKLRNLFRLYSDPSSLYEYRNMITAGTDGYNQPHQGVWMAVLDLVDPGTNQPLPLASGAASLSISSPDIQNWYDPTGYGWTWTNGNLDNIPIEILPGTGAPNPLNYLGPMSTYPLDSLEPAQQLKVSVQGVPTDLIGGVTFVFQYTNASFTTAPRVTTTTPDPNVQLASYATDNGDGSSKLTVVVINPHGFNVDNDKVDIANTVARAPRSLLRSLHFNIFWQNSIATDSDWQTHISLLSAQYVDVDGNSLSGVSTLVQKVK